MSDNFEVDFLVTYDEESILAELRRLAGTLGKPNVSAMDLSDHGRVKYHAVVKRFGSLRNALDRAGLRPSRCTNVGDVEMLAMLAELWRLTLRDCGRRPRVADLAEYNVAVSPQTIAKRFGSWKKALIAVAAVSADGFQAETRVYSVRRPLPMGKRFMVLKRDQYRCQICNQSGGELEVDHIVPVSHGGSDRMENLQTACVACNRGKGTQLL